MAAKSSSRVLSPHLLDIIDIGFGRWAKEEPLLARTACVALERLSPEDINKSNNSNNCRVFALLKGLITSFMLPENIWYSAADKAISVIYSIHPTPEMLATDLVKSSFRSVFSPDASVVGVPPSKLSRFLFIISHVSLNHLIYIESCVRKVQKQKASKEKSKLKENSTKSNGVSAEADSKVITSHSPPSIVVLLTVFLLL